MMEMELAKRLLRKENSKPEERRLFKESVEIMVRSNDRYPGTAAPDSRL
ncbi:MAG: hypothetical protein QOH41_2109 [Blastocatellia bacterium]|jgi:hypothetical protein|nr:hypothetical protein [Blastocatellia bacterium]